MKRKTLLFLLGLLCIVPLFVHAYDFKSGDLYYDITSSSEPYTVKVTYQNSTSNYPNLTTAVIPETVIYNGITYSVTAIGRSAFQNTGITSVTIPNSITSIGSDAFWWCGVTRVDYTGTIADWCAILFSESSSNPLYYAQNLYIDNVNVTEGALTIPEGVTAIGQYAFYNCRGLTSVTIPNSVTRIGYGAFYNVPNIIYHGSAQGSPWGALSVNGYVEGNLVYESEEKTQLLGCYSTAVGEIALPESVTSIGERAFEDCKGITSVAIPNSVTSIGESAFDGCSGLTSVAMSENVTIIRRNTFRNCSKLTSITIPDGVTDIEEYAFSGCTGLSSVTIPESVTSIGSSAFKGCTGLTSITIPESVTSIGSYAFLKCTGLISVIWNAKNCGDCSYYQYSPFYDLSSQITSFTFGDAVEHIPACLCYGMNYITSITIPESVTSIGSSAFYDCHHLTSITIPESVTSIGSSAFYYCEGLTSITLPESVTSIGSHAFMGCTNLTSVNIPDSVTSIGSYAFYNCKGLTSITIPENVTTIGGSAFYGCSGITMLEVPDNVTEIGTNAFYNLPFVFYNGTATGSPWGAKSIISNALREGDLIFEDEAHTILKQCLPTATGDIAIPATVTTIRDDAFRNCTNITSVIIPESVTTIGKNAFYGCTGVLSVIIPNGVTEIGEKAFYNVYNIQYNGTATGSPWGAKTVGGYIEGYILYDSEQKTTVVKCHPAATGAIVLPENVTTIEAEAFRGCESITEITIPENVTTIGKDAFYGCKNMSSVVWNAKNCEGFYAVSEWLGNVIGTIGTFGQGLRGNEYITSLTFGPAVEKIPKYLCYGMSNLTEIIIPEGVKTIETGAFMSCTGLKSITIPSSVTRIEGKGESEIFFYQQGEGAFTYSGLTSIVIPDNVTYLGIGTFKGCKDLKTATIGNGVTRFYNQMFYDCTALELVTLPETLTTIGSGCFENDSSLTSVTLPRALEYISAAALQNCKGLTSITIPENVTTIYASAFDGCTGLTSVTSEAVVPPTCSSKPFADCPQDIPVYVPCGGYELYLASADWNTFTNLQAPMPPFALSVYSGNPEMGSVISDKIQQCAGVGYLTATPEEGYEFVQWSDGNTDNPRTVELTQDTSFVAEFDVIKSGKCGDDLYWTYRDGEISITGTGAMYDYTVATQPWPLLRNNITAVSICNTATYIGTYAFADCGALQTVRFEEGICAYIADYAFFDCYSLDTLVIPDYSYAAATIGAYAFKNCSGLRSVSLGTSVHSVGQQAFYGCYGLNELSIYSRCSLDDQSFAECPSLSHIYNYNAVPNTCNSSVFDGLDKFSCTLHVPQGTTDKYRIASVWRDFYYMEEMVPTYTVSVETASADWGSVTGGGAYLSGTEITLRAVPATGYRFVRWNDGNTDNPRTIVLTQDTVLTAIFDMVTYDVTLSCDAEQGTVSGGGTYREGEQVTVSAMPNEGYEFVQWSDSNTDNPRSWIVTEDVSLSAIFQQITALPQTTAASQETQKVVKDGQVLILRNGKAYDMLGQEI